MKVFVPYVAGGLYPLTRRICEGYDAQFVELTHDESYPDYLANRWREGEPWVNVEHDVVPWPGAVESLADCPENWCGATYGVDQIVGTPIASPMLGLVRFRPEFMSALPNVWEPPWNIWGPRTWRQCDSRLVVYANLHEPPLVFHQHWPAVTHAHGWRDW